MSDVGEPLQRETALLFAVFAVEGVCGPGTLTFMDDGDYVAFGLAVVARGGACLAVMADRETARAAAKVGATDFTVDTLSEALRILKNEIRQRRPVSVGLVGEAAAVAGEMVKRGVQPQVVAVPRAGGLPWTELVERGAAVFEVVVRRGLPRVVAGCTIESDVAAMLRERRERDARLLASGLAVEDSGMGAMARQWLTVAPRLFLRDPVRWSWYRSRVLSAEEQKMALAEARRTSGRWRYPEDEEDEG